MPLGRFTQRCPTGADMLCSATERKRGVTMIDLYVELKGVLQALDGEGVPYALCGGLALMVYQRPRATVDIDVIVPAEFTGACIGATARLGFRAHPRPMRLEASGIDLLRLYKVESGGPDVLTLDCLLTTHPIIAEAWRSRVRVPFEDGAVWVVSLEGLIALKRLRHSPMDLLDIEALETLRDQRPGISPQSDDA
jgi:hypothetical protein